jgi:hypothetical protein
MRHQTPGSFVAQWPLSATAIVDNNAVVVKLALEHFMHPISIFLLGIAMSTDAFAAAVGKDAAMHQAALS